MQYFCTVFFMVLDLRLIKDWVVVMTILLFFCLYLCLKVVLFQSEVSDGVGDHHEFKLMQTLG